MNKQELLNWLEENGIAYEIIEETEETWECISTAHINYYVTFNGIKAFAKRK